MEQTANYDPHIFNQLHEHRLQTIMCLCTSIRNPDLNVIRTDSPKWPGSYGELVHYIKQAQRLSFCIVSRLSDSDENAHILGYYGESPVDKDYDFPIEDLCVSFDISISLFKKMYSDPQTYLYMIDTKKGGCKDGFPLTFTYSF